MSKPLTAEETLRVMNLLCYGSACYGCGGVNEPYMLQHKLWKRVSGTKTEECICLSCAERKLRRALTEEDFLDAPINVGRFAFHKNNWLNATSYIDFVRLTRDFLEEKGWM